LEKFLVNFWSKPKWRGPESSHPITFERLKKNSNRRSNAYLFLQTKKEIWKEHLKLIQNENNIEKGIWKNVVPIQLTDEYRVNNTKLPDNLQYSEAFQEQMKITHVWMINNNSDPIALFENPKNGFLELIWIKKEDYSYWSLNHNTLKESPEDFLVPSFLNGDPTFKTIPFLCAIESSRMTLSIT